MKKLKVTVDGQVFEVEVEALDSAEESSASGASPAVAAQTGSGEALPSPLSGKVVEVQVAVGDQVEEGDTLLVLEAMKMNTLVSAAGSGTIVSIHVAAGDMVDEGQDLVSIG